MPIGLLYAVGVTLVMFAGVHIIEKDKEE
jgi:hypothetical protein